MKTIAFSLILLIVLCVAQKDDDDPDYRPAFLHRTRGASIEKHRIGVQLPANRSRRDTSDEVNDGPGGAFEVKDSTDGQEGDDSLVELGDGRYGDSDGQGQERSGRLRRMLFSDSQESRRFPAHRRPFGIKNHCKIDKKGKRKCFLRDPDDQTMKSVKARGRRALSQPISDIQLENNQEFDEKLKDLKQWKYRKGQEDEDEKTSDMVIKRRRTFRRRCQIEGINGRRRCFPRPERQLESPKKENREHRKRNPDRQL
ncbi:unnamed protein product, partial [Mesorhabditis belari]|uniref:Uncharacterized protein n=1 Tax=Mesorhabditis belari TaxID=2138241 RepID=A0AAF3EQR2_9BILA